MRTEELTLESAQALREMLLSLGRSVGGEGVDQLRKLVLDLAHGPELSLRPVGKYWSAAMGASLQMIREPTADLPALGRSVYQYFRLGLDAWFYAQAHSIESSFRAATDAISLRTRAVAKTAGEPKSKDPLAQLLLDFCSAGSRSVHGDEAADSEFLALAEQLRTSIETQAEAVQRQSR